MPQVAARVEQRHILTALRVNGANPRIFDVIAALAGEGQVFQATVAAACDWNDVFDGEGLRRMILGSEAIFAAPPSALRNLLLDFATHSHSPHY